MPPQVLLGSLIGRRDRRATAAGLQSVIPCDERGAARQAACRRRRRRRRPPQTAAGLVEMQGRGCRRGDGPVVHSRGPSLALLPSSRPPARCLSVGFPPPSLTSRLPAAASQTQENAGPGSRLSILTQRPPHYSLVNPDTFTRRTRTDPHYYTHAMSPLSVFLHLLTVPLVEPSKAEPAPVELVESPSSTPRSSMSLVRPAFRLSTAPCPPLPSRLTAWIHALANRTTPTAGRPTLSRRPSATRAAPPLARRRRRQPAAPPAARGDAG
jgi:hypothetical protein